jgi:hypothetical protein
MTYGYRFAVFRGEGQGMRRPIRPKQRDLFAVPATGPLSLPGQMRAEAVGLLKALLLEVISHQRSQLHSVQQEPCREQQDHA